MWSTQEVADLSPNTRYRTEGYMLADTRKWTDLGRDSGALWGICQDDKKAYQTEVQLSEARAYACTCRDPLAPCKHALGLMFLRGQEKIPVGESPEWLLGWRKKLAKAAVKTAKLAAPKMGEAVAFLREWLDGKVRQGLEQAPQWPRDTWTKPAAHLAGLGAEGLALQLQQIPAILTRADWHKPLARLFGRLHRLVQSHAQMDTLEPDGRAELTYQLSRQSPPGEPPIAGKWLVAGVLKEELDGTLHRRTWLWRHPERPALVCEKSVKGKALSAPLEVGTELTADVQFYPGGSYRASLSNVQPGPKRSLEGGFTRCAQILKFFREEATGRPWLDAVPVMLRRVRILADWIVDEAWESLPMDMVPGRLRLLANGKPVDIFGEWDGWMFRPMAATNEQGDAWTL